MRAGGVRMADDVELVPEVAAVAAAISVTPAGLFTLADDVLVDLALTLTAPRAPAQQRIVAEQLLALIFRCQRTDVVRTQLAVEKIAVLFSLCFATLSGAAEALQKSGVALSAADAAKVGATASSLAPVVKQPGSLSPLDIRMGKKP